VSPILPPSGNLPTKPPPDPRRDFRLMTDAIQTGDVAGARQAYIRFTRSLPASTYAPGTTLGRIGALLDQGDVKSAQGILDGLQSKALRVLREVQRVTEGGDQGRLPPGSTTRITV
jgi:hypothetical protein